VKEKKNLMAHVIVSQGYPGTFGKYRMQAWVENVNRLLIDEGHKVALFTCGKNSESFTKNGVEVIVSKRLRVLNDPFSLDILMRVLLSKKPSITIIHGLQHLLTLFSLIICFLRKVPVVVIVHGLYLSNSKLLSSRDRLLKLLLRVFKDSYLVIALTSYDRRFLLKKWGISPDRIRVTKVFLYLSQEELQKIEQIMKRNQERIMNASDKVRFLYIGRLDHHQKRVDHLIKIFYDFLKMREKKYPDVELVVVGRGPLKGLLVEMVRKLGIQDYVKIVGAVSEEEKWLRYLTSSALVLTSRFEGLPRVIFEAFAAGKAVVVPNICGLNEVIQHRINGFLFNNDEEFLDILNSVVTDNRHRLVMQKANRALAIEKFNLEAHEEEMRDIIRDYAN